MKKTPGILVFLLASLLFTACITGGCGADEKKTASTTQSRPVIGVLLYREQDAYVNLVFQALQSSMAGEADIIMFGAGGDQLTQNEQVRELIAKKADALAVNIVDTQAVANIVDIIKKADIPVVFFNREPDLRVISDYDKACFVGTTIKDAGLIQGDIIAKLWHENPDFDKNKDGQLQFIMFQGNADNPEAIARSEYSVKRARAKGVKMRQIGNTYLCNWDQTLARESMQLAMILHQDEIEMIIANSDSMALGALETIQQHGYNLPGRNTDKFIPIVAVDAIPSAVTAIKKGIMSGTVKQDGNSMGQAIGQLLRNAINNHDFLEGTEYKWDYSGVGIRIPYSSFTSEP